jgi:hypothetical protein
MIANAQELDQAGRVSIPQLHPKRPRLISLYNSCPEQDVSRVSR